jgi:hypothetical protein
VKEAREGGKEEGTKKGRREGRTEESEVMEEKKGET